MSREKGWHCMIGLSEQELRHGLEEELARAMHSEGDRPTIHAIAHSIARMLELDHLRIADQLRKAGVQLTDDEEGRT